MQTTPARRGQENWNNERHVLAGGLDASSENRARKLRTWSSNGWQLRIQCLPVSSREIGDRPFDFRHPSPAAPAFRQMSANLRGRVR